MNEVEVNVSSQKEYDAYFTPNGLNLVPRETASNDAEPAGAFDETAEAEQTPEWRMACYFPFSICHCLSLAAGQWQMKNDIWIMENNTPLLPRCLLFLNFHYPKSRRYPSHCFFIFSIKA